MSNDINLTVISEDFDTLVEEHGETGGPDYNLGKEFSKRFTWATDDKDNPFLSITTTVFINAVDAENNAVDYDTAQELLATIPAHMEAYRENFGTENFDFWLATNPTPVRFHWKDQTEILVHKDADDLGGTEIWSDYEYGDGSHIFFNTVEEAEEDAKRWMDDLTIGRINPEFALKK